MLYILAALANFTGVYAHGVVGHRAVVSPLRQRLFATGTFGDEDMTYRIHLVSWHVVTTVFGGSGVAWLLMAAGILHGPELPRFLGALHLGFILVAAVVVRGRLPTAMRRPVPIAFGVCMSTVALVGLSS